MSIITIQDISKRYASGHTALKNISLSIQKGEIFALLGANGAGKTSLISIICGIVNPSSGRVLVDGHDIISDYRAARSEIGLVPQELTLPVFDKVINTIEYSRGLFGKAKDPAYIDSLLKDLSLEDKKNSEIRRLSGGMKRRVLIAKALSHQPNILFLDEPTAGVDVELRKDMWQIVEKLRQNGTTIILTTHYLEEAEALADRVGIMNEGELVLVEEKSTLLRRLGSKQILFRLSSKLESLPQSLEEYGLKITQSGSCLAYSFGEKDQSRLEGLLQKLLAEGIKIEGIESHATNLEDIFVSLTS